MRARNRTAREHIRYHKDGGVWAKGYIIDGVATGYWLWFRKDGVRMRSGYFEHGTQVGQWTTYDRAGAVYKVTMMKQKASEGEPGQDRRPQRTSREATHDT